jgi:hypothetical protein
MATTTRQVTDFSDFPGKLNKGTGYYELPTLYKVDSMSRIRSWKIVVRLIKSDKPRLRGIDWNLLTESQVPIKDDYFKTGSDVIQLPKGVIAQAWTTNGITDGGKQTRNSPTYKLKGSLLDRANERNAFQQALIYARSQWMKKTDNGCVEDPSGKSQKKVDGNDKRMFPMLATSWEQGAKHIKFPADVQEKLDGNRDHAYIPYADCGWEEVVLHSRKLKDFPDMDYMKKAVYTGLNALYDIENKQSLHLDGEFFKPGMKLQDITKLSRSGLVAERERKKTKKHSPKKRSKSSSTHSESETEETEDAEDAEDAEEKLDLKNLLEFHIYDCFYPTELDTSFESRYDQLKEYFTAVSSEKLPGINISSSDVVKLHPTYRVNNLDEAIKIFDEVISRGGEGIILRNIDGVYLSHSTRRSKDLVKMKKLNSDEYEIVGYTQGSKGKDRGAIIWIAKTKNNIEFNITPKGITYEERYKLFKECEKHFDGKYLGRMMTVEYIDLSTDKVPQHAKAVAFRDYE